MLGIRADGSADFKAVHFRHSDIEPLPSVSIPLTAGVASLGVIAGHGFVSSLKDDDILFPRQRLHRDFRPEHSIGAYEFATGTRASKDGKRTADGTTRNLDKQ